MKEKFQLYVYRHKCGQFRQIIKTQCTLKKNSVLEDGVLMKNGTTQSDICM